ncbi:MAG: hypothetical protein PHZ07_05255 [Patescibacteria group bacterium]|nr:hypothetical protein [Patescibacteria group bacterium]MDD4304832.1 hypothetical protein [Patescibacteria group bacterium]MDD4695806.1 hypothetical protein [Patescibacteria group bacterium]
MHVNYENEYWEVLNPPARVTVMIELRESRPNKKIDIRNCSTDEVKTVSLGDVKFDGE